MSNDDIIVINSLNNKIETWVRSEDGVIAGVCSAIAKRFNIDPWIVRLVWIIAVLAFGTGVLFYLLIVLAVPRESNVCEAYEKKVLGVCRRVSLKSGMDIGFIRLIALTLLLLSFGSAIIGYVVLNFIVDYVPPATK